MAAKCVLLGTDLKTAHKELIHLDAPGLTQDMWYVSWNGGHCLMPPPQVMDVTRDQEVVDKGKGKEKDGSSQGMKRKQDGSSEDDEEGNGCSGEEALAQNLIFNPVSIQHIFMSKISPMLRDVTIASTVDGHA
jgi:hypothetical protein